MDITLCQAVHVRDWEIWLEVDLSLDFAVARIIFNAQGTSICSSSGLLLFYALED